MFTGIVEHLGTTISVVVDERSRTLEIDLGPLADRLVVGDSVAVNGGCLTATRISGSTATFQAMGETVDRTAVGQIDIGDRVNLERPLAANGRFDGHIVQGHVDGTGTIRSVTPDGSSRRIWVDVADGISRYVVEKGSITVDGVSLTVSGVDDRGFEVAIIPHTLAVTTLGIRHPGDLVNIEVDVVAKYVERLMGLKP